MMDGVSYRFPFRAASVVRFNVGNGGRQRLPMSTEFIRECKAMAERGEGRGVEGGRREDKEERGEPGGVGEGKGRR